MITYKGFYPAAEVLADLYTNYDIERRRPLVFRAGASCLCLFPISYYEHPSFMKDLAGLLVRYYEVFANVEFLSTEVMKDRSAVKQLINQVTVYNSTKSYQRFIRKGLPVFLKKWAMTIEGEGDNAKYKKLNRWNIKRILKEFTADEALEVLFTCFVFNYDMVKERTLDFLSRLTVKRQTVRHQQASTDSSTKNSASQMPKWSDSPYSKSDLELFRQQATTKSRRR